MEQHEQDDEQTADTVPMQFAMMFLADTQTVVLSLGNEHVCSQFMMHVDVATTVAAEMHRRLQAFAHDTQVGHA